LIGKDYATGKVQSTAGCFENARGDSGHFAAGPLGIIEEGKASARVNPGNRQEVFRKKLKTGRGRPRQKQILDCFAIQGKGGGKILSPKTGLDARRLINTEGRGGNHKTREPPEDAQVFVGKILGEKKGS